MYLITHNNNEKMPAEQPSEGPVDLFTANCQVLLASDLDPNLKPSANPIPSGGGDLAATPGFLRDPE